MTARNSVTKIMNNCDIKINEMKLTAVDYYRKLNNDNQIKEHDGIPSWTPDDMIWFAEAYHKERVLKELSDEKIEQERLKGKSQDYLVGLAAAKGMLLLG